ncbi:hypothetical protein RV11_GL001730 [Enterococcus phoeniculicola]|jgi:hypothetical protein|uniref:hypothetical protein n=1 Tax=Enterococcus phoeniculicola TaxID=154621 RepID=UPI0003A96B60|nr:hypothetical protein [Enterococcus phoeniculicola]OJG70107.1 hypothetical protein RV11_GL001730 [Enterococcus phoeniculicola]
MYRKEEMPVELSFVELIQLTNTSLKTIENYKKRGFISEEPYSMEDILLVNKLYLLERLVLPVDDVPSGFLQEQEQLLKVSAFKRTLEKMYLYKLKKNTTMTFKQKERLKQSINHLLNQFTLEQVNALEKKDSGILSYFETLYVESFTKSKRWQKLRKQSYFID